MSHSSGGSLRTGAGRSACEFCNEETHFNVGHWPDVYCTPQSYRVVETTLALAGDMTKGSFTNVKQNKLIGVLKPKLSCTTSSKPCDVSIASVSAYSASSENSRSLAAVRNLRELQRGLSTGQGIKVA